MAVGGLRQIVALIVLAATGWMAAGVSPGYAQMAGVAAVAPTAQELAAVVPADEEPEVVRLLNAERIKAGLWPLATSPILSQIAREHSDDMRRNQYFGHLGSDGRSVAQRAADEGFAKYGWNDVFVGENIAAGYGNAAAVVAGWLASEGHRENILRPGYREVGVGLRVDPTCAKYCTYWTLDFGSQPNVLPVFIADGADQVTYPVVKVTLTDETVSSWGSLGPVRQVMLSSDPAFSGAQWQTYAQTSYFKLPAVAGSYAVYARLRDAAGQEVRSSAGVEVAQSYFELKARVFLPLVVR